MEVETFNKRTVESVCLLYGHEGMDWKKLPRPDLSYALDVHNVVKEYAIPAERIDWLIYTDFTDGEPDFGTLLYFTEPLVASNELYTGEEN